MVFDERQSRRICLRLFMRNACFRKMMMIVMASRGKAHLLCSRNRAIRAEKIDGFP
jgi:hypothetical protein